MEAVFSAPWQHSKLNISSLIKFDPALRQNCGPGNLQSFFQTSVIQCFQRPADGRGARLWYFEVVRQQERLRETQGAQLALGRMHSKPGSSRQHGTSTAEPRQGKSAGVAGEARDGRAGMETASSGRVEANPPETRLRFHGDDSAHSEGNAPRLPIARAKSSKGGRNKLAPLHPHSLSRIVPLWLRSAGSAPPAGPAEAAGGSRGAGAPPPPFRMPQPAPDQEPGSLRPRSAARCRSQAPLGAGPSGGTRRAPARCSPAPEEPEAGEALVAVAAAQRRRRRRSPLGLGAAGRPGGVGCGGVGGVGGGRAAGRRGPSRLHGRARGSAPPSRPVRARGGQRGRARGAAGSGSRPAGARQAGRKCGRSPGPGPCRQRRLPSAGTGDRGPSRRLRKPRVGLAASPRSEEARRQERSLPLPPPPIVHRRTEGTEPAALPPPPPPSPATGGLVAQASPEALTRPGQRLPRSSLSPATPPARQAGTGTGAGLLAIAASPGKEQLSQPSCAWKTCWLQWQLPRFPRCGARPKAGAAGAAGPCSCPSLTPRGGSHWQPQTPAVSRRAGGDGDTLSQKPTARAKPGWPAVLTGLASRALLRPCDILAGRLSCASPGA